MKTVTMIIDASVAIKWLVVEEHSDVAARIAERDDLHAPNLLLAEAANALCKKVRRGELEAQVVPIQLSDLSDILELVDESPHVARAAEVALQLGHSVYDCIYLAIAEARGDRLITADRKFLTKLAGGPFQAIAVDLQDFAA